MMNKFEHFLIRLAIKTSFGKLSPMKPEIHEIVKKLVLSGFTFGILTCLAILFLAYIIPTIILNLI